MTFDLATLIDAASWLLLSGGAFFFLIGGIGIVRMPGLFTRMHAVSVSETLGAGMILLGLGLQAGFTLVSAKLAMLFILFFFINPAATHALAQAAMHGGVKPETTDDLSGTGTQFRQAGRTESGAR